MIVVAKTDKKNWLHKGAKLKADVFNDTSLLTSLNSSTSPPKQHKWLVA